MEYLDGFSESLWWCDFVLWLVLLWAACMLVVLVYYALHRARIRRLQNPIHDDYRPRRGRG